MGLIQEVQTLKKESKYNTKEIEKQIKSFEKQLERARQEKEYKKDEFKAIENDLKELFKSEFNSTINEDLDTYEKQLKLRYNKLKTIEKRDEIIKKTSITDLEGHYVDNNYFKILNDIYKIYQEDLKSKKEIVESQKKVYKLEDLAPFYQWVNEHNERALKLQAKENRKKANKNGFITFLNLILSPWGK